MTRTSVDMDYIFYSMTSDGEHLRKEAPPMNTAQEHTKAVLTGAITFMIIGEDKIVRGWSDFERDLLNLCLKHKIFDMETIEALVHKRLLSLGQANAEQSARGIWADHVSSPQALAYALVHGALTTVEIAGIQFDGETIQEFAGRADGLREKIINQMLYSSPPVLWAEEGTVCTDGGPCTCC